MSDRAHAAAGPPSIERHDTPDAIAAEWDALADRVAAPPWLRPGWLRAWWPAFGRGRLEVLAVRRDGALAAVAPVHRRRGVLSSTTNWHSPGYGIVAGDAAARAALAGALLERRPRRLALHFLDPDSGDVHACAAAARDAGYRVRTRVEMRSPYIPTVGDLEAYVRQQRQGRKVLKELRRQRRRVERENDQPLRLRIEPRGQPLDEALAAMLELEGSGWKHRRRSAIRSREETRRFYEDVARWAAGRGTLRLAFLDVGSTPVAVDFLLEEAGALHDLKGGYAEEFRAYGPGKILLQELLQMAFDGPCDSLELLGSAEPYKLQWTDRVRERVLLQAFAPTPSGLLDDLAHRHGRPMAKRAIELARRARG